MKLATWAALTLSLSILYACSKRDHSTDVAASVAKSMPVPTAAADELVVTLTASAETREPQFRVILDKNGNPNMEDMEEPEPEKLVSGHVDVDGEDVLIFVPAKGPYSLRSEKHHSFDNTSTAISVDSNRDGKADRSEKWWTSLPIRIGDRMYRAKAIDPGATWIQFGKSTAPLAGAVVAKPMIPFVYSTTDGKKVSLNSYKGKWLLLDIWSYT